MDSDVETLAGARSQVERMDALDAVREFRLRIVVATDLIARGVDLGALLLGRAESHGVDEMQGLALDTLEDGMPACALSRMRISH